MEVHSGVAEHEHDLANPIACHDQCDSQRPLGAVVEWQVPPALRGLLGGAGAVKIVRFCQLDVDRQPAIRRYQLMQHTGAILDSGAQRLVPLDERNNRAGHRQLVGDDPGRHDQYPAEIDDRVWGREVAHRPPHRTLAPGQGRDP